MFTEDVFCLREGYDIIDFFPLHGNIGFDIIFLLGDGQDYCHVAQIGYFPIRELGLKFGRYAVGMYETRVAMLDQVEILQFPLEFLS